MSRCKEKPGERGMPLKVITKFQFWGWRCRCGVFVPGLRFVKHTLSFTVTRINIACLECALFLVVTLILIVSNNFNISSNYNGNETSNCRALTTLVPRTWRDLCLSLYPPDSFQNRHSFLFSLTLKPQTTNALFTSIINSVLNPAIIKPFMQFEHWVEMKRNVAYWFRCMMWERPPVITGGINKRWRLRYKKAEKRLSYTYRALLGKNHKSLRSLWSCSQTWKSPR